jgi:hypothetical protein
MAASERERDRVRRASISVVSSTPRELDQRSRRARDTLIYRADDFSPRAGSVSLDDRDGGAFYRTFRSHLPPPAVSRTSYTPRRTSVAGPSPWRSTYADDITTTTKKPPTSSYSGSSIAFEKKSSPTTDYDSLRARMNVAREQMSKHRTLIDRYLPFYSGTLNDHNVEYEVENKVNELAARMPQLDPAKRYVRESVDMDNSRPTIRLVEPYKPLPKISKVDYSIYSTLPPVKNSFTPKISDVRKRARSVLCKVKGDPRYFDL